MVYVRKLSTKRTLPALAQNYRQPINNPPGAAKLPHPVLVSNKALHSECGQEWSMYSLHRNPASTYPIFQLSTQKNVSSFPPHHILGTPRCVPYPTQLYEKWQNKSNEEEGGGQKIDASLQAPNTRGSTLRCVGAGGFAGTLDDVVHMCGRKERERERGGVRWDGFFIARCEKPADGGVCSLEEEMNDAYT